MSMTDRLTSKTKIAKLENNERPQLMMKNVVEVIQGQKYLSCTLVTAFGYAYTHIHFLVFNVPHICIFNFLPNFDIVMQIPEGVINMLLPSLIRL